MRRIDRIVALGLSIIGAGVLVETAAHADHPIVVRPGPDIQADAKTVHQIVEVFDRVQAVMDVKDLKGLMAIYSDHYNHGGLSKKDLEKFWKDIFARYNRIIGHHIFTKIVVLPDKERVAMVTCTGALWGTIAEKGKRMPIDSWFEEEHQLVYEDHSWRLVGAGPEGTRLPEFGTAPHPPF
jgi:hypothetical protein